MTPALRPPGDALKSTRSTSNVQSPKQNIVIEAEYYEETRDLGSRCVVRGPQRGLPSLRRLVGKQLVGRWCIRCQLLQRLLHDGRIRRLQHLWNSHRRYLRTRLACPADLPRRLIRLSHVPGESRVRVHRWQTLAAIREPFGKIKLRLPANDVPETKRRRS